MSQIFRLGSREEQTHLVLSIDSNVCHSDVERREFCSIQSHVAVILAVPRVDGGKPANSRRVLDSWSSSSHLASRLCLSPPRIRIRSLSSESAHSAYCQLESVRAANYAPPETQVSGVRGVPGAPGPVDASFYVLKRERPYRSPRDDCRRCTPDW